MTERNSISDPVVPQIVTFGESLPIPPRHPRENRVDVENVENELRARTAEAFFIEISSDERPTEQERFHRLGDVLERLEELSKGPVEVRVFLGTELKISQGPFYFLLTPVGMVPITTFPSEEAIVESPRGYMGPGSAAKLSPPTAELEDGEEEESEESPDEEQY